MHSYTQMCVCWETYTQGQTPSINLPEPYFHSHIPMVLYTHWDTYKYKPTFMYKHTLTYSQDEQIHVDTDNVANMHVETTPFTLTNRQM